METINTIAVKSDTKKLVVGWFSFTCSEDSTITLTELLNDHLDDWKKLIEFRFLKALKTHNRLEDLDVAFIEGAVSSEKQATEVKKIRNNAKYVIAVGACACTGLPSASRNEFIPERVNEKIKWYMSHFDYSSKVKKLEDVIKVDDKVEGCPMDKNMFFAAVDKYLKVFKII